MVVDKEESYEASGLAGWVMDKADSWRDHYTSNYEQKFDEYYRIFRGIWAAEDKMRDSERSKLISPATQQAVESAVSEVEEATFGRGRWFDIRDDRQDQDNSDVAFLREQLYEDFAYTKTRKAVAECILNSAIYGTGIGELVIEEVNQMKPATQPIMEGALQAVGVNIQPRTVVKLRSILPQNFLIDPVAATIEDAVGVIIDEFVPIHSVHQAMNAGIYKKVSLSGSEEDTDLEADKELATFPTDKVRITKYYGLVPKHLFEAEVNDDEEDPEKGMDDLADQDNGLSEEPEEYIEAIVVLASGGKVLKVEENPYMMQDRPVVAFSWDVVPGRFWGRGIVEKAYNSQKALDAELRARIDALALTVHPMIAMDATRLPRGSKFEVRPGKAILTNGNPAEIMMPFKFGSLDQVTFAQADALQRMVQTATGAVDSAGIAGSINGEATAAGISMSLGAIIKRHKRTLINFQECFLIPLVEKSAWRYMQFDPEHYPVQDFKFVASSSLGVIAREYEVTQLVQLLQTLGQDSPIYPMLVTAVIDNMGLANREELIGQIQQAMQPSPEAQQQAQMAQQVQIATVQADLQLKQAQAQKAAAEAQKATVQAELEPQVVQAKMISALSNNLDENAESADFERRVKLAELMLKERELEQDLEVVKMQTEAKKREDAAFDEILKGKPDGE
jgi:hypothetical protein